MLIRKKESGKAASADGSSSRCRTRCACSRRCGRLRRRGQSDGGFLFSLCLKPSYWRRIWALHRLRKSRRKCSSLRASKAEAPTWRRASIRCEVERPAQQSKSALQELLDKTPLLASLQVQSTERDTAGVFVRIHSAVILVAASDWNEARRSIGADRFRPPRPHRQPTRCRLAAEIRIPGTRWSVAARSLQSAGNICYVSDTPALMESMLSNFSRKSDRKPAELLAGLQSSAASATISCASRVWSTGRNGRCVRTERRRARAAILFR